MAAYPRVAAVKTIVDKALADAAVVGNQPVGSVTADITTAFTPATDHPGARDDRASESTLGNLVADSLRDGVPRTWAAPRSASSTRAACATSCTTDTPATRKTNGHLRRGQRGPAVREQPVDHVELTGAQFKTLLEQQWQTNPDGTVPARVPAAGPVQERQLHLRRRPRRR